MDHVVTLVLLVLITNSLWISAGNEGPLFTRSHKTKRSTLCPKEVTHIGATRYVWEMEQDPGILYAASKDNICWNNASNQVVLRKCDASTGKWLPSSAECAVWQENLFCPEDLIEIPVRDKFICIRISEQLLTQQQAESFCYGFDTVPTAESLNKDETLSFTEFLQSRNINNYWLPVRSERGNQLEPYVIRLPGTVWGELYKAPLNISDLLIDKNCLTVTLNATAGSLRTEAVHCDAAAFHAVCILKRKFLAYSGCPQGFGAMAYKPSECYGIEWEAGLFPLDLRSVSLAEYLHKRRSLQIIFDRLDLQKEEYFLVDHIEVDSNKYVLEMDVKQSMRIVPMLDEEEYDPALSSEVLLDRKNVEMTLKMDLELRELILTVYNRNYIWRNGDDNDEENSGIKCFTNADYEVRKSVQIDRIWENDLQTKIMFKLKLESDGLGLYWCEAHTVFNFSLITTPSVMAARRHKGHTFTILYNLLCKPKIEMYCQRLYQSLKPLSKYIRKQLNNFKSSMQHTGMSKFQELDIHEVRIMSVERIAPNLTHISCWCHVAASLKSSAVDNSFEDSSEEFDSEEIVEGLRHDTLVRMQIHSLLQQLIALMQPEHANSVRSTAFCFPESFQITKEPMRNKWQLATLGQTTTTQHLCLQSNGLPVMRRCVGDFLQGAHWEQISETDLGNCITETQQKTITKDLYALESAKTPKNAPLEAIEVIKDLLEDNLKYLIPADFYYIAKIMHASVKSYSQSQISSYKNLTIHTENVNEATDAILRIYNYLLAVNENVIRPSVVLNATNILLDTFENLIDQIFLVTLPTTAATDTFIGNKSETKLETQKLSQLVKEKDRHVETIEYKDVGVTVKAATNVIIFIIEPSVANITGIAVFNADDDSNEELVQLGSLRGAFKHTYYRFILANQTVDDLMYVPQLQLAAYVPETLWQRLDEISLLANSTTGSRSQALVVIKVYSNPKLFQAEANDTHRVVLDKVISVSIPGHNTNLPEMLPLLMRVERNLEDNNTEQGCTYWNYRNWVRDGLTYLGRSDAGDNSIILCGCTHLTPFAYLIGAGDIMSIKSDFFIEVKIHREALDVITLLGCSLSILGVLCIFVTAVTFQSWRQKASSKVLLQLSVAIAFQMLLFCFVNTEQNFHHLSTNTGYCIAIGACLHYSVLVQFSWMLIIAYLQFKRYVKVFDNNRTSKFFIKSALLGWGLPLIPVALVLLIDHASYIPQDNLEQTYNCYPSGYSLYFGVIFPVTLIIVVNFIIYVAVMYSIFRGPDRPIRHTEKKLALSQIRLSILLYFLLGFTWIFGLMATMKMGIVFSYLFCMFATLQGFVLFIYFIIMDPVTRRLWSRYFRRIFRLKERQESSTMAKETTQTL